MAIRNGYFYSGGRRYIPLGRFGCYFDAEYAGEDSGYLSQHGDSLIEFQRCTPSVWRKFFRYLSEKDGCTAIRMFPRGDSGGPAWEGLDIGGRVNRPLLDLIKAYMKEARAFGIKLQLCLFTEPECSFYCRKYTRTYWGRRLWSDAEVKAASPSQRRFLENTNDIVSYKGFFSDPDVRQCCRIFLDEIIPELKDWEDLFSVELMNESGWASPHAEPMNTFRWEITPDYIDWHREMTAHIKALAPDLPVCVSNPGVSVLGHDTVHWGREIKPDWFSLHNYPDICGARDWIDYAAVSDAALMYTMSCLPAAMGEWEAIQIRHKDDETSRRLKTLLARDTAWMTLLSGAPGCVSWQAMGDGQYHMINGIFSSLSDRPLLPSPELTIDISKAQAALERMWEGGSDGCALPDEIWCPDRSATDKKHRFCVKAVSPEYEAILRAERLSLDHGTPISFSLCSGIPLESLSEADFEAVMPYIRRIDGYQRKAFSADGGRVKIVYLRNYMPYRIESHHYTLRDRRPAHVTIEPLADAGRIVVYDLDTRESFSMSGKKAVDFGLTDHDFVVLMTEE